MAISDRPIVIKKVKKVMGGGHHGGAWKVAYADFVTAMMAFFLLMWLINTTSPEQKRGIADYFAPATVSQSTSGSGGILAGTASVEGLWGLWALWVSWGAFGGVSGETCCITEMEPWLLAPFSPSAVPARMPPEPLVDWLTVAGAK